jgi:DNA repair protein RadC
VTRKAAPIFGLFDNTPVTPESIKDEPDWSLVTRITGKLCPEDVNLRSLSRMTETELGDVLRLSPEQSKKLKAALTLGERLAYDPIVRGEQIYKASDVLKVFDGRVRDARKEAFYAMTLDSKHRVLDIHKISEGSLSMTLVHPREAFLPVIRDSAKSVIFVHNHPSGDPEPSHDDYLLTKRLVECGTLLGVAVKDHVIIGDGMAVSLRDRGAIQEEMSGASIAAEKGLERGS